MTPKLGAKIIWRLIYTHVWHLSWEDWKTRIADWNSYMWPLHVTLVYSLAASRYLDYLLTWKLRNSSASILANKAEALSSFMTQHQSHMMLLPPYSINQTFSYLRGNDMTPPFNGHQIFSAMISKSPNIRSHRQGMREEILKMTLKFLAPY